MAGGAPENVEWYSNLDLTSMAAEERKATIDLTNPRWPYHVMMRCPYIDVPNEFFTAMAHIGYDFNAENFVTPDGRSLRQWYDAGRTYMFLQHDVEKDVWHDPWGFEEQMDYIQDPDHYRDSLPDSQGRDIIVAFVDDMIEMQETLTNEQIIRRVKQYRGDYAYDISWQLVNAIERLGRTKEELDELVEQLTAEREDELRDIVYPEEGRLHERRCRETRERKSAREKNQSCSVCTSSSHWSPRRARWLISILVFHSDGKDSLDIHSSSPRRLFLPWHSRTPLSHRTANSVHNCHYRSLEQYGGVSEPLAMPPSESMLHKHRVGGCRAA